jgi:hypothetical protein
MINQKSLAVMWQLSVLAAWSIGLCEDVVKDGLRYQASRKWETRPNKSSQHEEKPCEQRIPARHHYDFS